MPSLLCQNLKKNEKFSSVESKKTKNSFVAGFNFMQNPQGWRGFSSRHSFHAFPSSESSICFNFNKNCSSQNL